MLLKQTLIVWMGTWAIARSANTDDKNFLTAFVSDYNSNKRQYISYFATATSYPKDMSAIALQVVTYTDDSYTTLLDNEKIDVEGIASFASVLPWYTRIVEHLTFSADNAEVVLKLSSSLTLSASNSKSSSSMKGSAGHVFGFEGGFMVFLLGILFL